MTAELVRMTKDGEALEVHTSCVAAHQRAGWAVSPSPTKQATESKGRKAKE